MPDLAAYHPIVVHFAIALLFVGVPLRWLAFWKKARFANAAAALLLLVGAAASVIAAKSGEDAHRPPGRVPGARAVVHEHEEHGERARNVFVVVGLIEVAGLVLGRRKKAWLPYALAGSAVIGTVGLLALFEAAEHGGELVYAYAGGVGTRSGEPEDVGRLLLAGLVHQAEVDRAQGRGEQASRLAQLAYDRFPDDPDVKLFFAESLVEDRKDGEKALRLLEEVEPEPGTFRQLRHGLLRAKALAASGRRDEARAQLEGLLETFPGNGLVRRARRQLIGSRPEG